ncbi:threonine/serine exporter family protein [Streptosporangiaceae bacterium NEAU-GS5]|nr:threonine/serine exporter family protein [Streptosporangiaceae bacterium NEAU-GS5]
MEEDAYRAIALALRVGELLLGSGEATEDVSAAMRKVTEAYGLRHCEPDVTLSAITLSMVPGDGRPPVTAERRVRRRQPDYDRLCAVHGLVREVDRLSPSELRERLRETAKRPGPYRSWTVEIALALIASFACLLVGGGLPAAAAAFFGTLLGDRASAWLARQGVAEFFQLAVAAVLGSLIAVLLVALHIPVNAPAAVVGAVIALLPGRLFVACAQDGISGDYVTATGRLTEIAFIMAAIVSGIGITITLGVAMGVLIQPEHAPIAPLTLDVQRLVGAVGVSVTFAVAAMTPPRHLVATALGGGVTWAAYVVLATHRLPMIMATAIAAALIGLLATLYGRRLLVPSLVVIVPAIGPLLPGTALYRALLEITYEDLNTGLAMLVQAASIALALGAGVNLGTEITRLFSGHDLTHRMFRPAARRTRGSQSR